MTQLTAKPFTARPLTARPFTAYPFGESTSVSNPLVWHAAYPDADGVMQAQLRGEGSPVFEVDDGLLLPDYQGVYVAIAANTPPWHGARWVDGVAYGTDGSGATLDPLPSLYGAPAYTNSLTYSNDLTNAAWTKLSAPIVTFDQVGITGAPNTATYFEDDDAANYERVYRLVTIADDSNTHTVVMAVKKDADTSRFPGIAMSFSGGTTITTQFHLNTSTGATATEAGSGGSPAQEAVLVGDWWFWRVSMTNNSTGNTSLTIFFSPARATTIGTAANAATGSIIVGNAELHLNKTIAQVRGSSPIVTAASTVTTTAISMGYDIANHSDTKGAYYCEVSFWKASAEGATQQGIISFSGSGFGAIYGAAQAGRLQAYDGTNVPLINTSWTSEESVKAGVAYGDNFVLIAKGVSGTETAYAGGFSGATGAIKLLSSSAPSAFPSLIRNIRRYNLNYTAAKAKIEELMI